MTDPHKRLAGDTAPQHKSYCVGDFLEDARGLELVGAVHVQAGIDVRNNIDETAWLEAIAEDRALSRGLPDAVIAYADLASPALSSELEAQCRHVRVRGVRQMLNQAGRYPDLYPNLLRDPAWCAGLTQIERHGLSFDLQIYPSQVSDAVQVIRSRPGITFIVDHAGLPPLQSPELTGQWRDGLALLAALPNTVLKISGFGMFDRQWTIERVRPFVERAVDLFSPSRCLFGSNFPLERLARSYASLWADYAVLIGAYAPAERAAMFEGNARRVYRLSESR
ncbi:amidohydrolase family protein [Paraburkholderia pallida]